MRNVVTLFVLLFFAVPASAETYDHQREALVSAREAAPDDEAARHALLVDGFDRLTRFWMGTTWGLGAPQTDTPQTGKINCGTFVGTVLKHLGFELSVKKLQRQPAELIIKSFTPKGDIMRFRNRPMDEFVERVAAAGDGVYIIGLDFHVGFLRVKDGEVRFVHASYVTDTVVDELATEAEPIITSKYRVVGKIFGPRMLDSWAAARKIAVRGHW